MIIAFDAKRLFNNFTGLGNYSRTLVKNLQKQYPEHSYHLFTPRITRNAETAYFLDSGHFTIHTSTGPLWRTIGMSRTLNKLNPDIYHGLSHELPFGLKSSIKKLVTFHDLIYEKYPDQFGLWDRTMYSLKYKQAAKSADLIISISESTKHDLTEIYRIPESKIKVVYQSCQESFINAGVSQTNISLPEGPYYLYVGSIIKRKNLMSIVDAFDLLPEKYRLPFVIVGTGPPAFVEEIQNHIFSRGLKVWFHFLSHVENHQLVALYDKSFALCYPSIYEGFGIPVIESLFRKKPVITSNRSSLPEAAGPGGLLVNPDNIHELVEAFKTLHDNTVYQSLSEKGYQYVQENFSAQITAKMLHETYLQVAGKL